MDVSVSKNKNVNHFILFILYLPILFIHYLLSQSFIASFTTYADVFVSGLFPFLITLFLLFRGYFNKIRYDSLIIFLIFGMLLISIFFSENIFNNLKLSISFYSNYFYIYSQKYL